MLKKLGVWLAAACLLFVLAACSNEASSDSSSSSGDKKTMMIGMVNPPVSFNTIGNHDVASQFVQGFVFDSLLSMEEPLEFVPKLAESFETEDNQTYTITLHPDAQWSDGKPVSADDLLFTLNSIANPEVQTEIGNYITQLEGVNENGKLEEGETEISSLEKIDEKTVSFKTKQPVDPNMLKEQLGVKLLILPKHAFDGVSPAELGNSEFMRNPTITSGPFTFVDYKKDQYVQVAANPDYYRGAPKLDEVFVKIIPAPNLAAQLQAGEIHMNAPGGIGQIPVQDFGLVEGLDNITTETYETIQFQTLMFNTESIADEKVRQAMAYALNRQSLVDNLLKGAGEVIDGPYSTINPYLNEEMDTYDFDADKAKQLLEEAGWDFDRVTKLIVPTGNNIREQSANIISENLKDVGLQVEIVKYDFPTTMQKADEGEHDLLLMGFTLTLDPDVSSVYGTDGAYNWMKYNNPEAQKLLEQGKSEPEVEKRKEIFDELQEVWQKDLPLISLYSDSQLSAVSEDVIYGGPKPFSTLADLHMWDIQQ